MSKANDPAFPNEGSVYMGTNDNGVHQYAPTSKPGLTKLEHFAGLAMQGLLSDPHWDADTIEEGAEMCVKWSAALIAELEKHHE